VSSSGIIMIVVLSLFIINCICIYSKRMLNFCDGSYSGFSILLTPNPNLDVTTCVS
jgi:hypothetical protein